LTVSVIGWERRKGDWEFLSPEDRQGKSSVRSRGKKLLVFFLSKKEKLGSPFKREPWKKKLSFWCE